MTAKSKTQKTKPPTRHFVYNIQKALRENKILPKSKEFKKNVLPSTV